MSLWRNDRNCKCMIMLLQKIARRKLINGDHLCSCGELSMPYLIEGWISIELSVTYFLWSTPNFLWSTPQEHLDSPVEYFANYTASCIGEQVIAKPPQTQRQVWYVYVYANICIYIYIYIHMYIHMHMHMYMHMHMHMYMYRYMYMYIYIYIYIYTFAALV